MCHSSFGVERLVLMMSIASHVSLLLADRRSSARKRINCKTCRPIVSVLQGPLQIHIAGSYTTKETTDNNRFYFVTAALWPLPWAKGNRPCGRLWLFATYLLILNSCKPPLAMEREVNCDLLQFICPSCSLIIIYHLYVFPIFSLGSFHRLPAMRHLYALTLYHTSC